MREHRPARWEMGDACCVLAAFSKGHASEESQAIRRRGNAPVRAPHPSRGNRLRAGSRWALWRLLDTAAGGVVTTAHPPSQSPFFLEAANRAFDFVPTLPHGAALGPRVGLDLAGSASVHPRRNVPPRPIVSPSVRKIALLRLIFINLFLNKTKLAAST
jgi:hypothetical protein